MIKLGLTGSIGMGKSTTALMFKELGYPVFDADAAVHDLYARGGLAVPLIRSVFPDAIKAGAVNRAVLGQHMRADPLNLQVLESFIHPMVAQRRADFIEKAKANRADIIIFDVPLLFETNGQERMDAVIVVTAPLDVQKQRVMARAGMSDDLFQKLLSRQIPDSEKRARADYLVFTDKGIDFARKQVEDILKSVKEKYAKA
jgi:dephospho-CoA kinase